jgi:quercetin dioxygenase-like cupin family protein
VLPAPFFLSFWRIFMSIPSIFRISCAATLLALTSMAQAGTCPADKVGANSLPGAATAPVGVTDTELASIDLAKENVKLLERRLRMRQMTIAPGGVVPLHSHADRPALITIVKGEIYEYNSKCTVPILHKAGETAIESMGTMHWWKNTGTVAVELTIGDIVNDKKPDTMMKMM